MGKDIKKYMLLSKIMEIKNPAIRGTYPRIS
jgi:hypothetical protein